MTAISAPAVLGNVAEPNVAPIVLDNPVTNATNTTAPIVSGNSVTNTALSMRTAADIMNPNILRMGNVVLNEATN